MAMGDTASENELEINNLSTEQHSAEVDFMHEFKIDYRLIRKKVSAFIRKQLRKNFINILYITVEQPPTNFICSLQKQYPDKIIKVLVPIFDNSEYFNTKDKVTQTFDYFVQNKTYSAQVFKIPNEKDNIEIHGIYSDGFSHIKNQKDIYNIKYMSHFTKTARKAAVKLKPDIIHADNIPLLLGLELGNRWSSGFPIKYLQTVHNTTMYSNIEPFWAAIFIANKKEMKKICNDNKIIASLEELFNVKLYKSKKINNCLKYLYNHFEDFRNNVSIEDNTRENIILKRIDRQIIKMFPNFIPKGQFSYNPILYSAKKANCFAVNSISKDEPEWIKSIEKYDYLKKKSENIFDQKVHHTFDVNNFREVRNLNKRYLIRELSEKRIETKFIDMNLFSDNEVQINGYLDSFFIKSPLYIAPFNEYAKESDIKAVSLAILKAFELRKNIQIIYNFPKDFHSSYLKSLIEFFESQSALDGKWISIEGSINMPQFLSAADMVLIPSGSCLNVEKILYTALKYGCIPVVSNEGICGDTIVDIFDDINIGCGFKKGDSSETSESETEFESTFLKALNFYTSQTSSAWNPIIKNAMNYDTNWDFESIEKYNEVYENTLI